jgi:hypothetical protein
LAGQTVSNEGLQAIEVLHKQNIGQLHGLHHEMRATLPALARVYLAPGPREGPPGSAGAIHFLGVAGMLVCTPNS